MATRVSNDAMSVVLVSTVAFIVGRSLSVNVVSAVATRVNREPISVLNSSDLVSSDLMSLLRVLSKDALLSVLVFICGMLLSFTIFSIGVKLSFRVVNLALKDEMLPVLV